MKIIKTQHNAYLSEALQRKDGIFPIVQFIFQDEVITEERTKNLFNRNGRLPKKTREKVLELFPQEREIPVTVKYSNQLVKVNINKGK